MSDQWWAILRGIALVIGGGWLAMAGAIALCIAFNRGRLDHAMPALLWGAAAAFAWLVFCLWYFR